MKDDTTGCSIKIDGFVDSMFYDKYMDESLMAYRFSFNVILHRGSWDIIF
jgi:hypothetical protein